MLIKSNNFIVVSLVEPYYHDDSTYHLLRILHILYLMFSTYTFFIVILTYSMNLYLINIFFVTKLIKQKKTQKKRKNNQALEK